MLFFHFLLSASLYILLSFLFTFPPPFYLLSFIFFLLLHYFSFYDPFPPLFSSYLFFLIFLSSFTPTLSYTPQFTSPPLSYFSCLSCFPSSTIFTFVTLLPSILFPLSLNILSSFTPFLTNTPVYFSSSLIFYSPFFFLLHNFSFEIPLPLILFFLLNSLTSFTPTPSYCHPSLLLLLHPSHILFFSLFSSSYQLAFIVFHSLLNPLFLLFSNFTFYQSPNASIPFCFLSFFIFSFGIRFSFHCCCCFYSLLQRTLTCTALLPWQQST
ncbi:unnamed protein product [Acanthosepion pharaonis]|uniref:Uncharacterized protein n=1 Tax=Acanthosepion pharaonis TaxID=158019 RepID=A0A812EI82_ACAPH|nr:unnamed protein product [Sepia pharaonis]